MRLQLPVLLAFALVACGGAVTPHQTDDALGGGGPTSPPSSSTTGGGPTSPPSSSTTGGGTGGPTDPPVTPPPVMPPHPIQCNTSGRSIVVSGASHLFGLAYQPDGSALATGYEKPTPNVQVIAASDGRTLETIDGHGNVTYAVAYSPDGKLIATGGAEPGNVHPSSSPGVDTAALWDAASGQLVRKLPATCGFYVVSIAFSHDGSLVVTSGYNGPIEVWRVSDGSLVSRIPYSTTVYSARFSPDDKLLITGGLDKVATIWQLSDGRKVRELLGHNGEVSDAAFSPDASEIATSSYDKTVIIWDAAQGTQLSQLSGHQMYIDRVVWIDRDHIATNDWGGAIKMWSRGRDGKFGATPNCEYDAQSQSIGLAVSPDLTQLSATGSAGADTAAVWTWPL